MAPRKQQPPRRPGDDDDPDADDSLPGGPGATLRKGAKLDGRHPTVLFGYGGFNISVVPSFSPAIAAWLEKGGVYAVANIRGGGEYGSEWHKAGTKERKQNVFDDFIAAGEWLVRERYTTPTRLAISAGRARARST